MTICVYLDFILRSAQRQFAQQVVDLLSQSGVLSSQSVQQHLHLMDIIIVGGGQCRSAIPLLVNCNTGTANLFHRAVQGIQLTAE